MNNVDINKLIAIKIMGLVEQIDFGEWDTHDWKLNEDGKIDDFAFEVGYCNGPSCQRCYYSYCEHCDTSGEHGKCEVEVSDYLGNEAYAKKVFEKINENNIYSYELKYCNFNRKFSYKIYNEKEIYSAEKDSISECICHACLSVVGILI